MTVSSHSDPEWRPFLLDRATTRVVRAAANGHAYRISVFTPDAAPPEGGFPSMIVLDGTALFATVAETANRLSRRPEVTGVRPAVIIGIGHDGEGLYDLAQRHRDFTPGPAADCAEANQHETGGADRFLDFLIDEVLPLVAQTVALDPARHALAGHSLAGLFTLHALASRPAVFTAYGAISPSIWWNKDGVMRAISGLSNPTPRLFLAAGARERLASGAPRGGRRTVESIEELGVLAATRIETALNIFTDEDHGSVVSVATTRFLRFSG